jgi:hypothetical protein
VAFESILNAAWLLMGIFALIAICARACKARNTVSCCIGAALIAATLFPVISASDDVIRIQHLERTHQSHPDSSNTAGHKRTTESLIRLYEAMESPLVPAVVLISFVLVFIFLVRPFCVANVGERKMAQGGRAPPACFA